jgi:hypothetical protein
VGVYCLIANLSKAEGDFVECGYPRICWHGITCSVVSKAEVKSSLVGIERGVGLTDQAGELIEGRVKCLRADFSVLPHLGICTNTPAYTNM